MSASTRTVPPRMRMALEQRDGGCRFPGCGSRFCDAHHVRHWADGGETSLDNLLLLCRFHHRAVHEGGYSVEMVEGSPRFRNPDGRPFPEIPEAPRLAVDAVASLASEAPPAATPPWTWERFDVDWAVAVLWTPSAA